jgi:hypothetical protein
MKIIITEDQFNKLQESDYDLKKTKELVISMYDQGMDINDIKKYTGLSNDILVLCLKYKKLIQKSGNCDEIHNLLYNDLWYTDFIEKEHTYDDGSTIDLYLDRTSGSIGFNYINNVDNELEGYATFLWDGECSKWPLDGEKFTMGEEEPIFYDEYYGNIDYSKYNDEFKKIESFNDIINFFNNHYFELIQQPIEHLIRRYIDLTIEMD